MTTKQKEMVNNLTSLLMDLSRECEQDITFNDFISQKEIFQRSIDEIIVDMPVFTE